MKNQEKDDGSAGPGGGGHSSGGGPSGVAQNVKSPPKKKKEPKTSSSTQPKKTATAKALVAAKKKEAVGKESKAKETKKRKDGAAANSGNNQTKAKEKQQQQQQKKEKLPIGGGTGGASGSTASGGDKKLSAKKSNEIKKKKTVANGAAAKDDRKHKDEVLREGCVAGSAVAANGWGFGTEVLTCLPRRVASLNAMAKVHIMYENETNRSTQHAPSTSSSNSTNVTTNSSSTSAASSSVSHTVNGNSNSSSATLLNAAASTASTAGGVNNAISSNEVIGPPPSTGSSQPTTEVDTDSDVTIEAVSTSNGHSSPRVDRMMIAAAMPGRCRRMASLNAQAILAASLCHDEKRPKKKDPPQQTPSASTPPTPTSASNSLAVCLPVIKIEDIEDEGKLMIVEDEILPSTSRARRKRAKLSKSPSGGHRAGRPKALKKASENVEDNIVTLSVSKEEPDTTQEAKVNTTGMNAVGANQREDVAKPFTFVTTSVAGSPDSNELGGVNQAIIGNQPLTRSSIVVNQSQNVQSQANPFTFSAAAAAGVGNAQNSQGGQTQMQGGPMYMNNMNMGNVNPGFTTLVTRTPHFSVRPTGQNSNSFGLNPTYYQVQPLIHKPIPFHPNGRFVGPQGGGNATTTVQGRTPARSIVVQVPTTRQTNQQCRNQTQNSANSQQASAQPIQVDVSVEIKNQTRSNGMAGGKISGVIQEQQGSSEMVTACQSAGGVSGRRGKMQQNAASGFGSAIAKYERNSDSKEKKVLTGIKLDSNAVIKVSPGKRKPAHGWSWLGEPLLKKVCTSNEQQYGHGAQMRLCYPGMQHQQGDVIRPRDCVLLKSGPRVVDLPFVAKVGSLWETPEGDMMISLLWYYRYVSSGAEPPYAIVTRPEHTEQGRRSCHMEDEIFASKHCDYNSVACIEDKCYVLSFAEYCRYRAKVKQLQEGVRSRVAAIVPPLSQNPRESKVPDPGRVNGDLVFFCRKVYDYRQKRILKNPSVQLPHTKDNHSGSS